MSSGTKKRSLNPISVPKSVTTGVPNVQRSRSNLGSNSITSKLLKDKQTVGNGLSSEEKYKIFKKKRSIENQLDQGIITKARISLYTVDEMKRIAGNLKITDHGTGHSYGSLNDPRLGTTTLNTKCDTCYQINCPGHYGYIDFGKIKIINPLYLNYALLVLRCVCASCSQLLADENYLRDAGILKLSYEKRLAAIAKLSLNLDKCIKKQCVDENCTNVRLCGATTKYFIDKSNEDGLIYQDAEMNNKKVRIPMNPSDIYDIFNNISDEDAILMGFQVRESHKKKDMSGHPRNMIMSGMLVLPTVSRPFFEMGNSIEEDPITQKFRDIVKLLSTISKETSNSTTADLPHVKLYSRIKKLFMKSSSDKNSRERKFVSISEKIQGKKMIMRQSLMGKRNNFCARSVASCDPELKFGEIGIPKVWQKVLTTSVTVNPRNILELSQLLKEGKITKILKNGGVAPTLINDKTKLEIGDKIDRWLQDGDWLISNRQPTLHSLSVMAYKVKLHDDYTVKMHLSVTTPLNLDFDGDEINGWKTRSPESISELIYLLNVQRNIMSVEQNRPSMGMVMNSVTAFYMLSQVKEPIDEKLYSEIIAMLPIKEDFDTLEERCFFYGIHPRSGAGLISALFPKTFRYSRGNVEICEGILISGAMNKSTVGNSGRSVIQELHKKYGFERTSNFFTCAPYMMNKWLMEKGFTVGMVDCVNVAIDENGELFDASKRIIDLELAKISVQVKAIGGPVSDPIEEEIRLAKISDLTNAAKGIGLKLAKDVLSNNNSIGTMSDMHAGTKGNTSNIGQIIGAVAQQNYRGRRLQPTITDETRLLPVYDPGDNSPEAHAFIKNSFFTGLKPEESFFLQAGGREGLIDTASNTSKTGTIQRRMVKASENARIGNDNSLRNANGVLFMPLYNYGYDPRHCLDVTYDGVRTVVPFDIKFMIEEINAERGWVTPSIVKKIEDNRQNINHVVNRDMRKDTIKKEVVNTDNKLTKFDKTRLLAVRAEQLDRGDRPRIEVDSTDPHIIAEIEYLNGALALEPALYIVRKNEDGTIQKIIPTLENITY